MDRRAAKWGLGWQIDRSAGVPVYWHNGGTYGFSSYLAFQRDIRSGVVVLCSQAHVDDRRIESLGEALLKAVASAGHPAPPGPRTTTGIGHT
jgi:hypothetical protein